VELAPLETLPHAVHLFLEQVAHNLWAGCYFYLNGPHVLQAGPQSFEDEDTPIPKGESSRYNAVKPFSDLGLETLAFPEYSKTFPHQTWTLGFTGRPGGPDFYINKVDNSKAHGPGGQIHHVLHEEGDSCFAKIVSGRENVAKIYQQHIHDDDSDWHYFLEEPIEIISATILNWSPPVVSVPPVVPAAGNANAANSAGNANTAANAAQAMNTNVQGQSQSQENSPFFPIDQQLQQQQQATQQQQQATQQQQQQQEQQPLQQQQQQAPQQQQQAPQAGVETDPVVDMINSKLKRKPKMMAKMDLEEKVHP
jgi:hypothetical protein